MLVGRQKPVTTFEIPHPQQTGVRDDSMRSWSREQNSPGRHRGGTSCKKNGATPSLRNVTLYALGYGSPGSQSFLVVSFKQCNAESVLFTGKSA